jgi:hypothetical protein
VALLGAPSQLLDARKGIVVGRVSTFSKTNEDALAETAESAVAEVLAAARARAGGPVAQAAPPKSPASVSRPGARDSTPPAAGLAAAPLSPPPPATAPPPTEAGALAAGGPRLGIRHPYVEARLGVEWSRFPLGVIEPDNSRGFGGGLAVRAGFRWRPEWAFEVGGGFESPETREFNVTHSTPLSGNIDYGAHAQATAVFASVGAAWAPRRSRYFAIAAEIGLATVHYSYKEWTFPGASYILPTADSGDVDDWAPRIGAELRLDYPTRWATVGIRLGVTAVNNGATATTYWYDGASDQPITWLEPGWLVAFPTASASVRYAF